MVASEAFMNPSIEQLTELAPGEAARALLQHADATWLAELQRSLDRQRSQAELDRILRVWGLRQSDLAALLGTTRQAIGKWRSHGVPASRARAIADLAAATDLLVHFLKPERIPAIVRRPAARLGNLSLLDLVATDRTRDVLDACRQMLDLGDAHA
jgi:hypothetical protein